MPAAGRGQDVDAAGKTCGDVGPFEHGEHVFVDSDDVPERCHRIAAGFLERAGQTPPGRGGSSEFREQGLTQRRKALEAERAGGADYGRVARAGQLGNLGSRA